MIISIIGSGNTATVVGKLLKENDHVINEIAGRNKIAVNDLAEKLAANACTELKALNKNSDLYIIAVHDDMVAEVAGRLKLNDKIVVHTAGSIPMSALRKTSLSYGVLYPLQSLRKELNYTPEIPFLIDGSNDHTKEIIFNLPASIAKQVKEANDEMRLNYHLAAIIVSNFSNHLFALAKDYCDSNNTDFKLLLPLIAETVNRMYDHDPSNMQTGPAARGDAFTIQKHLHLLNDFPQLKKIYALMSESIAETKK